MMARALGFGLGFATGRRLGGAALDDPFDPSTLSALAWYDPSDLSTLWQDSARTTPAVVGDPVGCIDDKSGNGLNLTQATAAARPTLRQDANGKYYLERDGVDDYMQSAASVSLAPGMVIAYAGQHAVGSSTAVSSFMSVALNTTNYLLCGFRQDVADGRTSARADSTSGALVTAQGTNGLLGGINATVISTLRAATATVSVGGGADDTIALSGTYGPVAACRIRLGTQAGAATLIATRCYGAIVRATAFSAAEQAGVVSYYNRKMGL